MGRDADRDDPLLALVGDQRRLLGAHDVVDGEALRDLFVGTEDVVVEAAVFRGEIQRGVTTVLDDDRAIGSREN